MYTVELCIDMHVICIETRKRIIELRRRTGKKKEYVQSTTRNCHERKNYLCSISMNYSNVYVQHDDVESMPSKDHVKKEISTIQIEDIVLELDVLMIW